MQGLPELVPSVPQESRRRPVGQATLHAYLPFFIFIFVTCIPSLDGPPEEDVFVFMLSNPVMTARRDLRRPCLYLFPGFFISSNERTCLCLYAGTAPEREGLAEEGEICRRYVTVC